MEEAILRVDEEKVLWGPTLMSMLTDFESEVSASKS